MNDVGAIWNWVEEMCEFCRLIDDWYTYSFSRMDWKIMRLYNYGLIGDDDLAGFIDDVRACLLQHISWCKNHE
ncbi:MAG: hypothetical protein Q4B82_05885 [Alysiella sp.]|uniref:hypothetical protein n=1 Tax=Alysiella sp. TaxID=1872483 RepID=UPI0026DB0BA6|nr:hypothetical protein [Alysiella sp.]MDO4434092.1 hypothetical protein [Alysiella sp.]